MAENFSKYLASLKAEDLHTIVDDDISSPLGPEDTIIALARNSYPEMYQFAVETATRVPGFDAMSEDERQILLVHGIVVISALCRKAEIDSMPSLD